MRLAREEKKGRFIAMVTIFICLTAVFIFTLAKNQIVDGKKDTASNTASVESTEVKATRGQILDRNGKVMEQSEPKQRSVVSENSVSELTDMLEDVIKRGTGTRANIGRPAAGKTGTTSDYHDAWFVGYTPDLVCGVWVGNDDNTAMNGVTGGLLPAQIWKAFMEKALAQVPAKQFDGSSAAKSGSIGVLENDKKSEVKKKDDDVKKKEDKDVPPQQDKKPAATGSTQPIPVESENSPQQPAEPDTSAPAPGGSISKGRN